jgi:hypothetical protein
MKLRYAFLVASFIALASNAGAQGFADAVRIMRDPLPVGARSTGMNRSLIAGIRDYTALDLNPAAIAPIAFREFGLTLSHREQSSLAQFLGNPSEATLGSTDLGSIGFAFKVPTDTGHFAFGIAYDRVADYSNRYSFKAVNNNSSFLNTQGFLDDQGSLENNLAYNLMLTEDLDSNSDPLTTRLKNGLEEAGTVTEEGGINALRIGAGIDVAEGVAIGGTMNVLFGNYEQRRVMNITDVAGKFSSEAGNAPNGFRTAEIIDTRSQSQAGLNLKLGLLVYTLDFVRFGLTVETPTWMSVEASFLRTGSSQFASGESFESKIDQEPLIVNDYDITTPFKFGAGVSFQLPNTVVAASAQYYDASQVSFGNSEFIGGLNDDVIDAFQSVLSWSVGVEHIIPPLGMAIRAGYGIEASPYKIDTDPAYDTKSLSAGLSVLLGKSTALDFSYRRTSFVTDHTVYNDLTQEGAPVSAIVDLDEVARNAFAVTFGYRF